MVTGQSVVRRSRLHLVLYNSMILIGVFWMIILDAVLFHIPLIVLSYRTVSARHDKFAQGYNVMEHIQLVGFCIQELIISAIYLWETVKLLRLRPQGRPRGVLRELVMINCLILVLSAAILVIEYVGYYSLVVLLKPVAYSVKVFIEAASRG